MDDPLAVRSLDNLAADLADHPERWENTTLPAFLDAFARYLRDLPGWAKNNQPDTNADVAAWRLFAVALAGATVYE